MAVGPDGQALVITVMQPPDPNVKLPPGVSPIGGPMTGHLWDAKTGKKSAPLLPGNLTGAVFSPDGKRVLLTNFDLGNFTPVVRFWSIPDRKLSAEKIPHKGGLNHFTFSDDGTLLAAATGDRTVRLYETTKMKQVTVLKGLTAPAEAVLFTPDGRTLVAAQPDGTIRVWKRKGA
jgi:WD40 repeat protein